MGRISSKRKLLQYDDEDQAENSGRTWTERMKMEENKKTWRKRTKCKNKIKEDMETQRTRRI
jgi:hypothetical protein